MVESAASGSEKILGDLSSKLTPTEREILLNEGMTQAKVSEILNLPVKVEVIAQHEISGVIMRQVRIYTEKANGMRATVYFAESVIPIGGNSDQFIAIMREKGMGIGQAINALHIAQKRQIIDVYADESVISRNYSIEGEGLFVLITEVFPRNVLKAVV
ncbi:hypothetical protein Mia14_0322 [Candidatus Mancarchaeum acidiphilum]|uniref:Uncharacterized protein n=1 Tax=Candidatus Mancarchaeum acidiphilum TaxID=1920749 RepID=A0A218NMF2_9ARCH|nr:hypothetical protein [Candidatus Mancarchaeum acidiphilum]ASI13649.1 hypothetical protein Mia14_0322 [Candidatus Mancarchaeum acidiphilum]